jgi:glycosyltransferase involved in cell wall biosynthesis
MRAFAKTRESLPSATLWIVGDGPLRATLEKLRTDLGLEKSVVFWGERFNPGDYLSNADVFVLSSQSEGLPMSLLEAMSAGLPAIVTDVGGMAEVARRFDLGPVVPCGNVEALAQAMLSCGADPAALQTRKRRAEAAYREHFTLEAMAESYLRLYQDAYAAPK